MNTKKETKVEKLVGREEKAIIRTLKKEATKQSKSYTSLGTELNMSPNSAKRTIQGLNSPTLTNLLKVCYGLGLKVTINKR